MSEFFIYIQLGYQHITDFNGLDHFLFIIALCAIYSVVQWKEVLILITAFTLGHSLTLALSSLGFITVNSSLIEFLIPLTIIATCIINFFHRFRKTLYSQPKKFKIMRYSVASTFGLIHGLGFSNYLKSLLGKENDIIIPLFSFNVGLELGQILIVSIVLLLNFLMVSGLNIPRKTWNLILSGIVLGMSLMLIFEKIKVF
jgi:hypothetical protein